jgi:biotin synthase
MLRIVVSPRFPLLVRSLATHAATTAAIPVAAPPTRSDWTKEEVQRIYDSPLLDLVFRAASVHRQHHDPSKIQLCTLMNIKSMWLSKARIKQQI